MKHMPDAVGIAYEIVALWEDNQRLERAAARGAEYERRYQELLDDSIAHGQRMMVGWLDALTSNCITIKPVAAEATKGEQP